jgi:signal recognition particle receptor subunit beta
VLKWKADLDNKTRLPSGDLLPCLLVANKCDLPARPVPTEEIQQMCDEQGFVGWIETSAKEDTHVDKAMRFLIEHILALHDESYDAPIQEELALKVGKGEGKTPSKCCDI